MRIWLSTAPPASRLEGAGGSTVDNRNQRQGLHLRNPKTCPNKAGHFSNGRMEPTPRLTRPKYKHVIGSFYYVSPRLKFEVSQGA